MVEPVCVPDSVRGRVDGPLGYVLAETDAGFAFGVSLRPAEDNSDVPQSRGDSIATQYTLAGRRTAETVGNREEKIG